MKKFKKIIGLVLSLGIFIGSFNVSNACGFDYNNFVFTSYKVTKSGKTVTLKGYDKYHRKLTRNTEIEMFSRGFLREYKKYNTKAYKGVLKKYCINSKGKYRSSYKKKLWKNYNNNRKVFIKMIRK